MNSLTVTVPLFAILPRKTKANKKITLSLNVTRNLNHFSMNEIKKQIAEIVTAQLRAMGRVVSLVPPVRVTICIWFPNKLGRDVANFAPVAQKFADDAVVKFGYMSDDKHTILPQCVYEFAGYDKENPRFEITYTQAKEIK